MSSQSLAMGPRKQGPAAIFLESQFCSRPLWPPETTDLTGKTVMVTGSNTGLGYRACRQFLSLGLSRLVMAVRSVERGEAAAAVLRGDFPGAAVDVWELDMGSYESVLRLARRAAGPELAAGGSGRSGASGGGLDAAVLNAGVFNFERRPSPGTGHEEVVQVNYLSTFLLAVLLLPVLRASSRMSPPAGPPGRLTVVSSGVSYFAALPNRARAPLLASFDDEALLPWDPSERYYSSKLLGHLLVSRLAAHVDPDDVVINLVDPGFCRGSELHREARGLVAVLLRAAKALTGRTLEEGASTYVDAAVVKGKETHGSFLMDWKVCP